MTPTIHKIDGSNGFWRDWYARFGLAVLILAIAGSFLPKIFIRMGLWPKPEPPPSIDFLMISETFFVRFFVTPILVSAVMFAIAAGRLLKRKKIF